MRLGGSLKRSRKGKPKAGGRRSGSGRKGGSGGGWPIPVLVLALAVVGWFGGYLVATQIVFPAPPPPQNVVDVPDVRGLGLTGARERIEGAGLMVGAVDSLRHPTASEFSVMGQSPLPGQLALPGAPVRITLSLGPQQRTVPDVAGLDARRARIILETTGFVVRADSIESELPRGRVVDLSPSVDSLVAIPSEVHLVVSTGPPVILMPLVLGLEEDHALAVLDSLGLVVGELTEVFRFGRDQGIVVEQEPAADTELQRGAAVRLSVGRRGRDGG
ncbi:MAG: PASTA domain-containing protein [Longimicrobiales bacterium]